jgi:hypothetical protein
MAIEVHFRGVGIFVTDGPQAATEVLFPNAESVPPDAVDLGGGVMGHADRSKAKKHHAGILTVSATGQEHRRALASHRVDFPNADATSVDASFHRRLPPLKQCTNADGFRLRLLPEADREGDRVATRIVLRGGTLEARPSALAVDFEMNARHGTPGGPARYSYDVVWTTGEARVLLDVTTFDGQQEDPIELDSTTPEAYFYCFDNKNPKKRDLTRIDPSACAGRLTDDDFKWVYMLFDRAEGNHQTWQDWLEGNQFPAPWTNCRRRDPFLKDEPLIPVSTCYSAPFDGP